MPKLSRYGSPCAVCGILRDYHGLAGPRPDHAYISTAQDETGYTAWIGRAQAEDEARAFAKGRRR
jgi:hypothetical protein